MPPAAAIPASRRDAALDALERERFDVAVIGGGITGAGIAREAAQRGLRVALLEADDFASGTSSRSSKLIHGGLRYLAQGEVNLVRETALERKEIWRQAPHLAERRWMVVPARTRAGLMKLRVGIGAYEKLGQVEDADVHRNWGSADLEREEPALDRATYAFACAYREYLTDDARLVLANLRAAVGDGAVVLNHAAVVNVVVEDGHAAGVEAVCRLAGRRVRVRARAVVNAAGPWVDALRALEDRGAAPLLHLSKGVHVVLRASRLPVRNMVVLGTRDGRSIFVIRRGPVVYLGTTDTSWPHGSDLWPEIGSDDVEYLLEPVPRYFAVEPVKPEECVAAWAGLRPLVAEPGKDPREMSRRDEILEGPAGVVTIAGGKLTGYRPMARRAVEQAAGLAGLSLAPAPAEERPLPGGDFDGDLDRIALRLARETGVSEAAGGRLARLYGSEAGDVVALGTAPLARGCDVLAGEVVWGVEREGACTLEDALYRRTRAALFDPDARERIVEPIARAMAERLGWSDARAADEIGAVRARLAGDLAFAGPRP
jgi:glycerol-3-phosphate dehydrogenase